MAGQSGRLAESGELSGARFEPRRTLVLEAGWEGNAIRLVISEPGAGGQTVLPQRRHRVDEAAVQCLSAGISSALESASHGREDVETSLHELQAAGRELLDLLLDPETKSALLSTSAVCLLLRIDDHLITIPWELLFDGNQFLGERFAVGRQVMAERPAPESGRMRECRPEPVVKVLGSGNGDLAAPAAEAGGIHDALADGRFRVGVNLEATPEDFKRALHTADSVHFCGHADFDPEAPERAALIFEDGTRLTAEEIRGALVGAEKVPRLVFLNACGTGRSGSWGPAAAKSAYGLGNAFLLGGVGHVIATFCDVGDRKCAEVGEAFYCHLSRGASIGEALQQAWRGAGCREISAGAYVLYGSPQSTLEGDDFRAAVNAGFEPRQLPSGRTLSALDRLRVNDYSTRQETQLLTLVLVELMNSQGTGPSSENRGATERVEAFRGTVRQCLAEHPSIEEITCVGELFLIATVKPSDAVRLALMVQSRTGDMLRPEPETTGVRIALHLGEVAVKNAEDPSERRDLFGYQVDLANRVLEVATAGQILMTRPVFDNARAILRGEDFPRVGAVSWLDHGACRLQGVEEPVGICEAGEKGWAPLAPPPDSEKARRYVAPDQEPVLGWRPALEHPIPGTGWVLTEKLGEGGFGEVWRARHKSLKETRVFKFCFREDRVRFLKREVTLFRLLKEKVGEHPNVVRIYDVFFDEPPYYIGMEDVPGGALPDWWEANGADDAISMEARVEIAAQVADALQAAHEAGIIHRDVKPSNILISGTGARPEEVRVKLTDFGIGQLAFEESFAGTPLTGFTETFQRTEIVSRSGTRLYAAPEVLAGQPSSTRSDIYSLGVVLYQLLVGDFLRPASLDWQEDIEDPVLGEDLARCFAGDPEERFAGAAQISENLRSLEERRKEFEESEKAERAAARRRRVTRVSVTVSAILLLLALALGYGLRREQIQRARTQREFYYASIHLAAKHIEDASLGKARELLAACPPEYRGWEWGRLQYLCNLDVMTLKGHSRSACAGAFSPDGKLFATGSWGGSIKLWDLDSGRELRTFSGHLTVVTSVAFSPDGKHLVCGSGDGTVRIWDVASGKELRILQGPGGGLTDAAISPDGKYIATSGTEALLWSLETGDLLRTFADEAGFSGVAFSPDGRWLATAGYDGTAKVWDVESGTELQSFKYQNQSVFKAVFIPAGKRLVTAGHGQPPKVWDLQSGEELLTLEGHSDSVFSVDVSPDGKHIATASEDGTTRIWNAETGSELRILKGSSARGGNFVTFSSDCRYLATNDDDGAVRIWCLETAGEIVPFRFITPFEHSGAMAFSPDGKRFALAGVGLAAGVTDLETGHVFLKFMGGHPALRYCIAFSPDGKRLATAAKGAGVQQSAPEDWDHTATLWDAETGQELLTFRGHTSWMKSLAFGPNGKRLATASTDGTVRVWDTETGRELNRLPEEEGFLGIVSQELTGGQMSDFGLEESTGDKVIEVVAETGAEEAGLQAGDIILEYEGRAVGPYDEFSSMLRLTRPGRIAKIKIYRPEERPGHGRNMVLSARISERPSDPGGFQSVAFNPNGQTLAAAGPDGIRVWDVETGRESRRIEESASCVLFSPDGVLLAAIASGHVGVWNLQRGKQLQTVIRNPTGAVISSIFFSPDSRRLATGGGDYITRVWDTETGRELLVLVPDERGIDNEVTSVALSPDGKFLVTRAGAGKIRFWPAFPWKEEDYPGDESMPLADRIELFKRAYWKERTQQPGWAAQSLETSYVTDWWIIGPFDNTGEYQFSYPHPPEKEVDLSGTYAGIGKDVRWERLKGPVGGQEPAHAGYISLAQLYDPDEYVAAYALTYMYSPVDRKLGFLIGTNDSVRFWLNDELIWSNPVTRGAHPDNDVVEPVFVSKGWNKILLRVSDNNAGDWGFYFRVTDEDYRVVFGLKFDPLRGEKQ